jgi:8-oxo-dGTP pyrophosphatase MutT (NUDIX family)
MLKRIGTLKFAPHAHVFPGVAVDARDSELFPLAGAPLIQVASVMDVEPLKANQLMAAAVRETFEESGIVLASNQHPTTWSEQDRQDLLLGRTSIAQLLNREQAHVHSEDLIPWAWWLTPDYVPFRFDTWFFFAPVRAVVEPRYVPEGEAVEARWWKVDEALEANRSGEIMLLWPTLRVLLDLNQWSSVSEAVSHRPVRLEQQSG